VTAPQLPQQTWSAELDAQLFVVKHLLILREQITAFVTSAQHVTEKRLDFTPTTAALRELIQHRGMLFSLNKNNAILELVQHGVPLVQENRLDCKRGLEARLRDTCRDLRVDSTKGVLRDLLHFLAKAAAFSPVARVAHGRISAAIDTNTSGGSTNTTTTVAASAAGAAAATGNASVGRAPGKRLVDQPFGSREAVKTLLQDCKGRMVRELELLKQSMKLYLRNDSTEAILFGPIPTQVFATLNDVKLVVEAEYSDENEEVEEEGVETAVKAGNNAKVTKVELVELLDATRAAVSAISRANANSNANATANANSHDGKSTKAASHSSSSGAAVDGAVAAAVAANAESVDAPSNP
jgi:hypothetical protein